MRATSLVETSLQSDAAVGSYELPKSRDSNAGIPGKNDTRAWVPPRVAEYTIGSMVVAYSRGPGRGVSRDPKCPWLVSTPKGVPECELTTWVVCFDADSSLIQ
jgi:hypothetical protein